MLTILKGQRQKVLRDDLVIFLQYHIILLIGTWTTKRLFSSLQALPLVSQVSCGL